jgi:hypothetical protein
MKARLQEVSFRQPGNSFFASEKPAEPIIRQCTHLPVFPFGPQGKALFIYRGIAYTWMQLAVFPQIECHNFATLVRGHRQVLMLT